MTEYVQKIYTNNSSSTFIGEESESRVVIMALFLENSESAVFNHFIATDPSNLYNSMVIKLIENNDFPKKQ